MSLWCFIFSICLWPLQWSMHDILYALLALCRPLFLLSDETKMMWRKCYRTSWFVFEFNQNKLIDDSCILITLRLYMNGLFWTQPHLSNKKGCAHYNALNTCLFISNYRWLTSWGVNAMLLQHITAMLMELSPMSPLDIQYHVTKNGVWENVLLFLGPHIFFCVSSGNCPLVTPQNKKKIAALTNKSIKEQPITCTNISIWTYLMWVSFECGVLL